MLSHEVCGDLLKHVEAQKRTPQSLVLQPAEHFEQKEIGKQAKLPQNPGPWDLPSFPDPQCREKLPLKFSYLPTDRVHQNATQLLSILLLRLH